MEARQRPQHGPVAAEDDRDVGVVPVDELHAASLGERPQALDRTADAVTVDRRDGGALNRRHR